MALSLQAHGIDVGRVTALRVLALSESGRVQRAEISGERGRIVLSGPMLTTLLRNWGLKSTRFVMRGDLLAYGDGWGHGVGMSQYGARSLAAAGYRFDEILAFYYPHTRLQALPYSQEVAR
jgi:stage II sporulation protein D